MRLLVAKGSARTAFHYFCDIKREKSWIRLFCFVYPYGVFEYLNISDIYLGWIIIAHAISMKLSLGLCNSWPDLAVSFKKGSLKLFVFCNIWCEFYKFYPLGVKLFYKISSSSKLTKYCFTSCFVQPTWFPAIEMNLKKKNCVNWSTIG